jgi:hypothetical protein
MQGSLLIDNLVDLSNTLNLPDRNNCNLIYHTNRSIDAFASNDPKFPFATVIQEKYINPIEETITSLFNRILFSIVIGVILAIVIVSFFHTFPIRTALLASVLICVVAISVVIIVLYSTGGIMFAMNPKLEDVEAIEANRINAALCAYI